MDAAHEAGKLHPGHWVYNEEGNNKDAKDQVNEQDAKDQVGIHADSPLQKLEEDEARNLHTGQAQKKQCKSAAEVPIINCGKKTKVLSEPSDFFSIWVIL